MGEGEKKEGFCRLIFFGVSVHAMQIPLSGWGGWGKKKGEIRLLVRTVSGNA